jgi:hypothetical protein
MYIVAGLITVLWAFVILFFMPPDPIRAKGFNERERYIAVARMKENNSGVRNKHFKIEQALESLYDIKFWIVFSMAFLIMIANGPVSSFIPIIISGFGYNRLNSLLLTMPAGVVIGTIELSVPYLAYKFPGIRTWLIAICQCGTILASLLLWLLPRSATGGLLFACYILASFGGAYAVLMGLQIANTAGYTKRSVTSSGIFVGYCLGQFPQYDKKVPRLTTPRQFCWTPALQARRRTRVRTRLYCCACDFHWGRGTFHCLSVRLRVGKSEARQDWHT